MNKGLTEKKASVMEKSGGKMSQVEEITKDKGPEFGGIAGVSEKQVKVNLGGRETETETEKKIQVQEIRVEEGKGKIMCGYEGAIIQFLFLCD